jgi:DNA-binding NarL/FixJ family response regulator
MSSGGRSAWAIDYTARRIAEERREKKLSLLNSRPFMLGDSDELASPGKATEANKLTVEVALLASEAAARLESLTRREWQVLHLLANGASNKQIARQLDISARTVEIHRGNMMRHLKVKALVNALRIWIYAELHQLSDQPGETK